MAKTNESGSGWDQDLTPVGVSGLGAGISSTMFVRRTQGKVKADVVRDDWDDDDDDDDDDEGATAIADGEWPRMTDGAGNQKEEHIPVRDTIGDVSTSGSRADEDSSRLWEEANTRPPMPELIVARASTSHAFPPPPPAALQPMLRILKRPSPNGTGASSSVAGSPGASGTVSPAPRGTLAEREAQYQEARNRIFGDADKGGVVVVRDPLGPASELEPGRPAKGFGERRRGGK